MQSSKFSKYSKKILLLAEIMGIPPSSICMEEDSFDIIETYKDNNDEVHYEIRLRSNHQTVFSKVKKQ